MKNKKIKYICILMFFLLCGIFYTMMQEGRNGQNLSICEENESEVTKEPEISRALETAQICQKIYVYVCGAVKNPGVYEAEENARVYQLIQMAGGILPEGAENYVNQAAVVGDGDKLYVPFQTEVEQEAVISQSPDSGDKRVNINTASQEELMNLPGIGASKAQSIIQYREEHGAFQDVEELTNITGIKSGVYEKIKELVRIR